MSAYTIHKILDTLKKGYSQNTKANNIFAYTAICQPFELYEPLGFPSGVIEHHWYMNQVRTNVPKMHLIIEYGWGDNCEDIFACWIGKDDDPIVVEEEVLEDVLIKLYEEGIKVGLGTKFS